MPNDDLELQIKHEQAEIENAPKVPLASLQPKSSGMAGRCHWCGRISSNLVAVHDYGPEGKSVISERYKGIECCGERHA